MAIRSTTFLAAAFALLAGVPAAAQSVGPPVAEYSGERAAGTFELTNNTLVPATVVIEPFAFRVDTLGQVEYLPFDSARVKVKLSATTIRVPPRSSFNVAYDAATPAAPAWFVIASNFSGPRTEGLNVRIQLPHVVYLGQRAALEQSAVQVLAVVHDTAAKKVRVKVQNTSDRLGRCLEFIVRGEDARADAGAFPLFPSFWRWVEVEWAHAAPPTSVRLAFERFTMDVNVADVARHAASTSP